MRKFVEFMKSYLPVCVTVDTGKHSNELLLERDHSVMEIHV